VLSASITRPLGALASFVRLGRPVFLLGGVVLHGLGAALAVAAGASWDAGRWARGQLVVTLLQLMTHYANDYFDRHADRANATPTLWSGGSRVLASGRLPDAVALVAAVVLAAAGLVTSGVFVAAGAFGHDGGAVGVLTVAIFALAWGYSAPPLRLHTRGLGPLVVPIVVTVLVPLLGFSGQGGAPSGALALLVAPFALEAAMIVTIDVPDAEGDAAAGKRTYVVRFGRRAAARACAGATVAAFAALPLAGALGAPLAAVALPLGVAPLAAWQVARVARGAFEDPRRWESLAFVAVASFFAVSALELAGVLATLAR
jgi:1,4-dihydroxy-2-naphthoate octaprenyltransferase